MKFLVYIITTKCLSLFMWVSRGPLRLPGCHRKELEKEQCMNFPCEVYGMLEMCRRKGVLVVGDQPPEESLADC